MKKRLLTLAAALTFGAASMFPSFTAIADDDLLAGFSFEQYPSNLEQHKAHAILEKGAAIVIDVRSADEFAEKHIPGSYNVPLDAIAHDPDLQILKENDTPVLLVCRSGRRSGMAMHQMVRDGYKHVFNIGGVITWEYGLTDEPTTKSFRDAVRDVKPLVLD